MTQLALHIAIVSAIYGLLVLSLNFQYGQAGLLNFGHIAFFAVGAYAVAAGHQRGWPALAMLAAAPLLGGLVGYLMCLPVRRLKQEYWALMTLGVAELFRATMENEEWIAGGMRGTRGIPALTGRPVLLAILLGLILVSLLVLRHIQGSQFGRVINALREDELLVETLGRNSVRFQLPVMIIGGAIGGIAGGIFAHYLSIVNPAPFQLTETFIVWTILIVGGIGNYYGALAGALFIQVLFAATRFLPGVIPVSGEAFALIRTASVGALLVAMIILRPGGIIAERRPAYRVRG